MGIEEVQGFNMVHAVTGNVRRYILCKVGSNKRYLVEVTQQQSEAYFEILGQLCEEAKAMHAQGQTSLKALKAWASQRKAELLA